MRKIRRAKRWISLLLALTLAFSNASILNVPTMVFASEDTPEVEEISDEAFEVEETASPEETAEVSGDIQQDTLDGAQPLNLGFAPVQIPVPEGILEDQTEEYTVSFTVDGDGTVIVNGQKVDEKKSINVAKDSEVTFTAQADDDDSVGEVKVDGSKKDAVSQDGNEYTYKITVDSSKVVNISFMKANAEPAEDEEVKNEEDQNTEYAVTISHILYTDNIGKYRTIEKFVLEETAFNGDSADLNNHAYNWKGMAHDASEARVSKDDFSDGHADITINYSVEEGYVAVRKDAASSSGIMTLSAFAGFEGEIEDVEIVQEPEKETDHIQVTINFVYENRVPILECADIRQPQSIEIDPESTEEIHFSYEFVAPDVVKQYKAEIDKVFKPNNSTEYEIKEDEVQPGHYTITTTLDRELVSDSVNVVFLTPDEVKYTVVACIPRDGYDEVDLTNDATYIEKTPVTKTGKVGENAVFEPDYYEGFTPQEIPQVQITGNEIQVIHVPYVRNRYTITYDTDGGSYIAPQWNISHGNPATVYTAEAKYTPTKPGYTFQGWYESKADSAKKAAASIDSMTSDVTVYAKWKAGQANYTVIYWKEIWDNEKNDSYYGYISSKQYSATVGTEVSGTGRTTTFTNSKYYVRNDEKSNQKVEVKADGSTVVNIYYDLIRYTYRFDLNKDGAYIQFGENGHKYYDDEYYIEGAVLGMDVYDLWPAGGEVHGPGNYVYCQWDSYHMGKPHELGAGVLMNRAVNSQNAHTFKLQWSTQSSTSVWKRIEYWMQTLEDPTVYRQIDKYQWDDVVDYSLKLGGDVYGYKYMNKDDDWTPEGFQEDGVTPYKQGTKSGANPAWVEIDGKRVSLHVWYFDRKSFKITYMNANDNTVIDTHEALYEADITGTGVDKEGNVFDYNFVPDPPEGSSYEPDDFQGWYTDSEGQHKYTFGTMPGEDVLLYAVWELPNVTVTAYNVDPEEDEPATYTVKKTKAANIKTPACEGWVFEGWYTDSDYQTLYDVAAPVYEDTKIYAKWRKKTEVEYTAIHIILDENKKEQERVTVTKTGQIGAKIVVSSLTDDEKFEGLVPDRYEYSDVVLSSDASENVFYFYYSAMSMYYTVRYVYKDDTTIKIVKEIDAIEAPYSPLYVYPNDKIIADLEKQGYQFNGYRKQLYLTSEPENNVVEFVLTAKPNSKYTIDYEGVNDEAEAPDNSIDMSAYKENHPTEYTEGKLPIKLENPEVEGYEFIGWTTDAQEEVDGVEQPFTQSMDVTISDGSKGNLVFTAHFREKRYDITVNVVNGTAKEIDTDAVETVKDLGTGTVIEVKQGDSLNLQFAPNEDVNYVLDSVTIDGEAGALNEGHKYSFNDIQDDRSITVEYAEDTIGGEKPVDPDDPEEPKEPENPDDPKKPSYPDGIPDKYQAVVTYKIENGTWAKHTGAEQYEIQNIYTLKTKDPASSDLGPVWKETDVRLGNTIPTDMKAETGYGSGKWLGSEPRYSTKPVNGATYMYAYTLNSYTLTLTYKDDNGNQLGDSFKETVHHFDDYNKTEDIKETIDIDGHHYLKESVTGKLSGTVTGNITITVVYTLDDLKDPSAKTDPENPNVPGNPDDSQEGDGIPDKYQITVYFNAVNGTFIGETSVAAVLTRYDETGNWSKDGKVSLEGRVPEATANRGYQNGKWDTDPTNPETAETVEDGAIFTITFSAIPAEPDPTDDDPTPDPIDDPTPTPEPAPTPDATPAPAPVPAPVPAVVPAAPAAAPVAADDTVTIDDEGTPLAAGLEDGGDGIIIGDEGVPLAPLPEEIACCILHLLILCVAMLVELYYFHDRKKRQKKEREVRLELGR